MKKLTIIVSSLVFAVNLATAAEAKVDFAKDIQPILQQNCFKCHGAEKQKGKLRLDLRGRHLGAVSVPWSSQELAAVSRRDGAALIFLDLQPSSRPTHSKKHSFLIEADQRHAVCRG